MSAHPASNAAVVTMVMLNADGVFIVISLSIKYRASANCIFGNAFKYGTAVDIE